MQVKKVLKTAVFGAFVFFGFALSSAEATLWNYNQQQPQQQQYPYQQYQYQQPQQQQYQQQYPYQQHHQYQQPQQQPQQQQYPYQQYQYQLPQQQQYQYQQQHPYQQYQYQLPQQQQQQYQQQYPYQQYQYQQPQQQQQQPQQQQRQQLQQQQSPALEPMAQAGSSASAPMVETVAVVQVGNSASDIITQQPQQQEPLQTRSRAFNLMTQAVKKYDEWERTNDKSERSKSEPKSEPLYRNFLNLATQAEKQAGIEYESKTISLQERAEILCMNKHGARTTIDWGHVPPEMFDLIKKQP